MSSYIAAPTSRVRIRRLVSYLREQFDLSDEKYFPVVHFLEFGLSQIDEDFDLEITSLEEMPNDYAVTYPEQRKIIIREDVYINAINGIGRDRFTIAHEIGHYIMHRPGMMGLARNYKKEKIPVYKHPEWQANTFAGELLAPPHIIKGLNRYEIAEYCGVSLEVAEIQLSKI